MSLNRGFPANDTEKLSSALYKAQFRAKVRTVETLMVQIQLQEVYMTLQQRLYKKDIVGLIVTFDWHAQTFPKSYRYTPMSTKVSAKRTSKGWSIVNVGRWRTQERVFEISGLEDRHEALARYAIRNIFN